MDPHCKRRRGKSVLAISVTFGLATCAVLWSWNSLAAELVVLPHFQLRHAFSAVLLVFVVGLLFHFSGLFVRHSRSADSQCH